jgi:hypothetical protein
MVGLNILGYTWHDFMTRFISKALHTQRKFTHNHVSTIKKYINDVECKCNELGCVSRNNLRLHINAWLFTHHYTSMHNTNTIGKKISSLKLNHTNPFCGLFMMWVYQYAYSNCLILKFWYWKFESIYVRRAMDEIWLEMCCVVSSWA